MKYPKKLMECMKLRIQSIVHRRSHYAKRTRKTLMRKRKYASIRLSQLTLLFFFSRFIDSGIMEWYHVSQIEYRNTVCYLRRMWKRLRFLRQQRAINVRKCFSRWKNIRRSTIIWKLLIMHFRIQQIDYRVIFDTCAGEIECYVESARAHRKYRATSESI